MNVQEFEMVRMQYAYEGKVEIDFSGSGVPSLALSELIEDSETADSLLKSDQNYPPSGGSPELRSEIASMYRNASEEEIFVTNGATEANFMAAWHLLQEGDEIVVMVPGYMQTWNLARSWGLKVHALPLNENLGWQFDTETLKAIVSKRTKAIHVCNPNNPTGAIMADEQRKALMDCAEDAGSWILSDEVYIGSEMACARTEPLWGDYERTLLSNGLCKSYGLPGLRIGWLVGARDALREIAPLTDYLTLTHAAPCDYLARLALEERRRERLLARNQAIIREGHANLESWMNSNGPVFSYTPPAAGPMCFIRYSVDADSCEVARQLITQKSVLVVPGSHMGMDGYFRIGTSVPKERLANGLDRIDSTLRSFDEDVTA